MDKVGQLINAIGIICLKRLHSDDVNEMLSTPDEVFNLAVIVGLVNVVCLLLLQH